jgi:hypothetical protein
MATIKKKIENLKPGKNYLVTARAKDPDLNSYSEAVDSIVISIPGDSTIPEYPKDLALIVNFEKVMFKFSAGSEKDLLTYQYELYKSDQVTGSYPNEVITGSPISTGFSAANVFTVSVEENTSKVSSIDGLSVTNNIVSYVGRVKSIDTSGNPSPWSPFAVPGATTLIGDQYIDNLTASKITAGTIGAHTITLNGANSIIKSSIYNSTQGWQIDGIGNATFNTAIIRGEFSSGTSPNWFRVDASGNIWSGANTYANASTTFRVSNTGQLTANSGLIGGFSLSTNQLSAGTGSNKITISTGDYNVTTNPDELVIGIGGNLSSGFGLPFAVNSSGVVNASAATVGPLQLDDNGLTSYYFNNDNYIRLNTFGDFYKYAKRTGTQSYYYLTYMLGELLQIKRTSDLGVPTGSGAFFGYNNAGLVSDEIIMTLNTTTPVTSGAYVQLTPGTITATSFINAGSFSTSGLTSTGSFYSGSSTVSRGEISKTDGIRTRARINDDSLLFWNSSGAQKSEYSATGFYVDSGYSVGAIYANTITGPAGLGGGRLRDRSNDNEFSVNWTGSAPLEFYIENSNVKNFTIQHPLDDSKWLLHACAEGPTADVFYRGEGQLVDGECIITLPEYFESITLKENRTVILTPICDEDNKYPANVAASRIKDGKFWVTLTGGYNVTNQKFYWRVDAVRKNAYFNSEPFKDSVEIFGNGPYTYSVEK